MGPGRSLEAAYELEASVPAGDYQVIFDAIIIVPVDVMFDLVHRRGATDTTLATWMQHFEPAPEGFEAQTYELAVPAPAIDFAAGDLFIFRYTGDNSTAQMAFIPVGNPELEGGRFPNITLPK